MNASPPFTLSDGREFSITKHALTRFLDRAPDENLGKNPEATIRKIFKRTFRIKFSPKYQLIRLLNNDIEEAEYRYSNGWIFVCTNKTIVTIERQEDKKFGKDLFEVKEEVHAAR